LSAQVRPNQCGFTRDTTIEKDVAVKATAGPTSDVILLTPDTLTAGTLAAVTEFGGAAILLPLLVAKFGTREAIPILTVAQMIGRARQVWFNSRE
jgi:hypothetical protein